VLTVDTPLYEGARLQPEVRHAVLTMDTPLYEGARLHSAMFESLYSEEVRLCERLYQTAEEFEALHGFGSADRQTPRSSRSQEHAGLGVGMSSVSVTSVRAE
jgi:hypothetical protein